MGDVSPPSRISARFYLTADEETLSIEVIDSLTDQRVAFELPIAAVPTVADGLREVVDANPDWFPEVISSEFIHGGGGDD